MYHIVALDHNWKNKMVKIRQIQNNHWRKYVLSMRPGRLLVMNSDGDDGVGEPLGCVLRFLQSYKLAVTSFLYNIYNT